LGELDSDAGEFWVENPFQMLSNGQNLSAFEPNRLFLNQAGRRFVDLSSVSGADLVSDSRSIIAADFDRDGAPDLLVVGVGGGPLRLLLNRIPTKNGRLRIELRGTKSNRSGIGARVTAKCGEQVIVRDVYPANGFMGQGPVELLLGVGQASHIDTLSIHWPSGVTQQFTDVPVQKHLVFVEGEDEWIQAELRGPATMR
jgi:hypothetical protein